MRPSPTTLLLLPSSTKVFMVCWQISIVVGSEQQLFSYINAIAWHAMLLVVHGCCAQLRNSVVVAISPHVGTLPLQVDTLGEALIIQGLQGGDYPQSQPCPR